MSIEKEILLYTLTTCRHCRATKELLSEYDMDFECIEVDIITGKDRQDALEGLKKINPKCSFPTVKIGDDVIVGFKEEKILETLGVA